MGLDVSLWGQFDYGSDFVNQSQRISRVVGGMCPLGELRGDVMSDGLDKFGVKSFRNLYCEAVGLEIDDIDHYAGGMHIHSIISCGDRVRGVVKYLDDKFLDVRGSSDDNGVSDWILRLREWFNTWLEFTNVIVDFCD